MVGRRRLRRPAARIHRSIDDKFDTLFRYASQDRVNEVHRQFAAKLDSYARSERGRSKTALLFELRSLEHGCSSLVLGGNLTVPAPERGPGAVRSVRKACVKF